MQAVRRRDVDGLNPVVTQDSLQVGIGCRQANGFSRPARFLFRRAQDTDDRNAKPPQALDMRGPHKPCADYRYA